MGLNAVFVFFGCAATAGFAVAIFLVVGTKGRVLERLSPQLDV
jgi:hypothetical protein